MNKAMLIKTLREVLDPASPNVKAATKAASEIPPEFADKHEWFLYTVSRAVQKVLSKYEPFKGGGFLVQQANGWIGFHANEASLELSRRVLEGQTPEQAVAWLEKVLATNRADAIAVLALRGISVPSVNVG